MNELLFLWIAVLIQSHAATPEQVLSLRQAWQPACLERGGELMLSGKYRVWNGRDAFVIEGQCARGPIEPARNSS